MCGRYSFAIEDALILERFGLRVRTAVYKANYNCSPTQKLAVITNEEPETLNFFRWGLIPFWSKIEPGMVVGTGQDLSLHHDRSLHRALPLQINARAETITEKPSFKHAFRNRRCLVPATGFYEWKHGPGGKGRTRAIPFHFGLKSGEAFSFAGLWDKWVAGGREEIYSFTIITTIPNELVEPVHNRMPVILRRGDEQRWLAPDPDPSLAEMLIPYPAALMDAKVASEL